MDAKNNPWVALFRWASVVLVLVILLELALMLWNSLGGAAGGGEPDDRQLNDGLQVSPLPGPESFGEIIERSLFSWNRKPLSGETGTEPSAEGGAASPWQLAGLVDTGRSTYAIFKEVEGRRRLRLEQGDELDGWTIESLDTRQVVLVKDGQRETYYLSVTGKQRVVEQDEATPETGDPSNGDDPADEEQEQ